MTFPTDADGTIASNLSFKVTKILVIYSSMTFVLYLCVVLVWSFFVNSQPKSNSDADMTPSSGEKMVVKLQKPSSNTLDAQNNH